MGDDGAGDHGKGPWVRHGLAASFDLLSSEYGWTDDQILDLTLGRIRLSLELIGERRAERTKELLRVMELHAKTVITGMAGAAQSSRAAKGMVRYAQSVSFVPGEEPEKELPSTEAVTRLFSGRRR